jgi:hypothetical protein
MDEPDDEEQQHGADRGVDDRGDDSGTNMETQLRHQPTANEGADNTDQQVTNEAKSGPVHYLTGQPTGNDADE